MNLRSLLSPSAVMLPRPDKDSTAECCQQINNGHNQVGSAHTYEWVWVEGEDVGPIVHPHLICRPPSLMKQKNAFPPNFVHSLDSTHMLLTSLHCQRCEPRSVWKII